MATTVIDSIPFKEFAKDIPIGVVIDFGISEFIILTSELAILPIINTDTKEITIPQPIPTIISNICFLNNSNCL